MTGLRARVRKILLERQREEAAVREAIERLISRGPPAGSGISLEAWRTWHRYGFVACPASMRRHTCSNHRCRMGAACREVALCLEQPQRGSPCPSRSRDKAFVLAGNTLLSPLVNAINRAPITEGTTEAIYEIRLTTDAEHLNEARAGRDPALFDHLPYDGPSLSIGFDLSVRDHSISKR
jgi:hypothetical protein